jgi:hypothetical protein
MKTRRRLTAAITAAALVATAAADEVTLPGRSLADVQDQLVELCLTNSRALIVGQTTNALTCRVGNEYAIHWTMVHLNGRVRVSWVISASYEMSDNVQREIGDVVKAKLLKKRTVR